MRWLIPLLLLIPACTAPQPLPPPADTVSAKHGVVVSVSTDASVIGREILTSGGNAIDAAVATAFALAVTFPEAGNIGGGGFMLIHFPDREPALIDYRETAPAAVHNRTFYRPQDRTPHRLSGVPGTVRGLSLAHSRYGKLPWRDLVNPAVALARNGFTLDQDQANALNRVLRDNPKMSELQRVFAPPAKLWKPGDKLCQPNLSRTLQLIAENPESFYTGPIADQIVAEMQRNNGLITSRDLANYRPKIRKPLHGTYRGYDLLLPPPPSSGGVAIIEMLNILENFELRPDPRYSDTTIHLMTQAMRHAFADRARYLADPDFADAFPPKLIDKQYACPIAATLPGPAGSAAEFAPEIQLRDEPEQTTHFSIADKEGIAVSNTYTLEQSFGGKIVVAGAGFLLNNELGDFNPQPDITTRTGQIGTAPNLPAPGKRPLSSMTPTIVLKNRQPVLITGSPGGRTIINTVLCILVNRLDYDFPPELCVDAPRQHHQWLPDQLCLEKRHPPRDSIPPGYSDTIDAPALSKRGHRIVERSKQGDAHTIFWDEGTRAWIGVADKRRSGAAAGY